MLAALWLLFCLAVASAGTVGDQGSVVVGTEPNNPSPYLMFLFEECLLIFFSTIFLSTVIYLILSKRCTLNCLFAFLMRFVLSERFMRKYFHTILNMILS